MPPSPSPTAAAWPLKGAFTIDMTEPLPRTGAVAFQGQGPLSLALEMLDREPFHLLQKNG